MTLPKGKPYEDWIKSRLAECGDITGTKIRTLIVYKEPQNQLLASVWELVP